MMDDKELMSLTKFLADGEAVVGNKSDVDVSLYGPEMVIVRELLVGRVDRALDRYVAIFHKYPSFARFDALVDKHVTKYLTTKGMKNGMV
jgi:hypothetical protein